MDEHKVPRTWAETREAQVEFEELVEEEKGDWGAAAKDVLEGKHPEHGDDQPPLGGF
jgi:hypothetical protein